MFYNPQTSIDRINSQIAELEKLKSQIPSVQPITQNFQLAPQNALRYANNIDEVQKEYVTGDTQSQEEVEMIRQTAQRIAQM